MSINFITADRRSDRARRKERAALLARRNRDFLDKLQKNRGFSCFTGVAGPSKETAQLPESSSSADTSQENTIIFTGSPDKDYCDQFQQTSSAERGTERSSISSVGSANNSSIRVERATSTPDFRGQEEHRSSDEESENQEGEALDRSERVSGEESEEDEENNSERDPSGDSSDEEMAQASQPTNYWDSVVSWLKEDESIALWLDEAEIKALVSLPEEQLDLWRIATQYQGFDVKTIIKNMHRVSSNYMISEDIKSQTEKLRVGDVQKDFTYTNKEKMMTDISFLIFLFSTRGSDWVKIYSKSVNIVKHIMDWMKEKYEIDTARNAPGVSLRPEAVTLPRIAACFPMKVCDYFHKGFGKPLCGLGDLAADAKVLENVSRAILCSYFPACLPAEWVKANTSIHFVPFWVAVLNDNVLHRADKKYTSLQAMFSYYSASYKSNATPQKSRVQWCIARNMSNAKGDGFIQVLLTVSDYCHTAMSLDRKDDPGLRAVETQLCSLV